MADKNMTTTSRLDHPVGIHFIKQFLAYAMPGMPYAKFGQQVTMPAHAGETVKFRRWAAPTAQTTPLQEDVDPAPILPHKTDISATVREYGARVRVSAWLDLTGLSQEGAELTKWLSDQFALTIDTLCREVLAAGASTYTCANGSPTTTLLNATDLDIVVQTLLGNNARPITPLMTAAVGQGTSPLSDSFVVIAHTDLYRDLKAVAGWRDVRNYAAPGQAYDGEVGATDHLRWILTTNGYKSGSNYYCTVLARDAFGNIRIPSGEKLLGYKPPEQAGSEMNRYSVYFWLANYVAQILNDAYLINIICTKSS